MGAKFLPHEAMSMTERFNEPNVQYCVEVSEPKTRLVVDRFTIEQIETGAKAGTTEHRNYNTVQYTLNYLSVRNSFDYKIVRWGDVCDRSKWLRTGVFDD